MADERFTVSFSCCFYYSRDISGTPAHFPTKLPKHAKSSFDFDWLIAVPYSTFWFHVWFGVLVVISIPLKGGLLYGSKRALDWIRTTRSSESLLLFVLPGRAFQTGCTHGSALHGPRMGIVIDELALAHISPMLCVDHHFFALLNKVRHP